nr:monothiol bacilliredoxin BrxC family protein [Sporosarcina limicola]
MKHESPQLLILKNGKGVWQTTHYQFKRPLVIDAIGEYALD